MKISLLLLLLIIPLWLNGQEYEKRVYTTTTTTTPPVVDGDLSDEAWTKGEWGGEFIQFQPAEGAPVSQKTEFKVLYDNSNIYVAIKAYDTAPDSIVSRMTRRDHSDGDELYVYFDSYHDLRTAFGFGVSAAGVKADLVMTDDGASEDETFDPIWYVKTSITDWGWAAEMRIPLTQLRFSAGETQIWGFEVLRIIYRHDETDFWQPIPRNTSGLVHQAGLLEGIQNIKPRTLFDITPYGVAKLETYEGEAGNPWLDGTDFKATAGIDAKIGITNNMILSLTVNPDFGQVEADPSVVNLTAFESFFEEKRPFFIESKNITDYNLGLGQGSSGNDNLFYSRRIGRNPRLPYSPGENEYTYTPSFTPILGAAKLTGKSGKGWSVGALEAVAAEVSTKVYNEETGKTTYVTAEPFANFAVARVQKDIKEGNTIIGGMMTSTIRSIEPTTEDYYHKNATSGGIDFTQYFGDKNYIFQLRTAFSNIQGTAADIARTQRSAIHNFIRPDADYVEYDTTRTSLSGFGGNLMAGKIGGNFNVIYLSSWKSPGLELNDIGYMRVADQYIGVAVFNYNIYKPFSIFNQMSFGTNIIHAHDFGGTLTNLGSEFSWQTQFRNLWSTYFGGQVYGNEIDNNLLRGGPSIQVPGNAAVYGGIDTDDRKKFVAEINVDYRWGFEDVFKSTGINIDLIYRPVSTLSLSVEPGWEQTFNKMQYVTTASIINGVDAPRYVFGFIDQKILSLSFRIDYNITPDLTIQYWGQPFFGSGDYNEFKYITDQSAAEEIYTDRFHTYLPSEIMFNDADGIYNIDENLDGTVDYSFENPDFTISEYLHNLVVRWEFLPGSTAYLVWSQTRNYFTDDGTFDLATQANNLFTDNKPYNVFLVKFSYRFGLR